MNQSTGLEENPQQRQLNKWINISFESYQLTLWMLLTYLIHQS
jgi:hypothetical protein